MPKYYIVHEVSLDATIDDIEDMTPEEIQQAEVVGVYRAPTLFCTCAHGKKDSGFTRGQKYGWWVHARCGKPTRQWGLNPGAVISAVIYHLKLHRTEPVKVNSEL